MTKKWHRNDKEMTKTWQKNDTNPKWQTQMQKKCNKNAKKWQNNYFGFSNVCRPKIFLRVKPKILSNNTGNRFVFFAVRWCFKRTFQRHGHGTRPWRNLKKKQEFSSVSEICRRFGEIPLLQGPCSWVFPSELQNVTEHFEGYIYPTSHLGGQQPWYEALMFVFLNLRLLRVEPAFSFVALITEFESCDTKTWRKEQTSAPLSGVERSRDCHWKGPLRKKSLSWF